MTDTLIALVTDRGFLVPYLVVARQLVKQSIDEIADIVIYTVNIDAVVVGELSRLYARRVRFEALSDRLFLPPETAVFYKNHVPTTTLARLSLPEIIRWCRSSGGKAIGAIYQRVLQLNVYRLIAS